MKPDTFHPDSSKSVLRARPNPWKAPSCENEGSRERREPMPRISLKRFSDLEMQLSGSAHRNICKCTARGQAPFQSGELGSGVDFADMKYRRL